MDPITLGTRPVGSGQPAYLLAEIGTNHDADLDKAQQLITLAADAGADGVKFQLFRADQMYPDNIGMVDVCGIQYDFYKYLQQTEMPAYWLPILKAHCAREGIGFVVSAFDPESLEVCLDAGVDAIKIASAEMNYHPLVCAAAASGVPLIVSTGFSAMDEVIDTVNWVRAENNDQLILLQCTGAYPTPPDQCHLAVMQTYADTFGCAVGFSDHTRDWLAAPLVAVAHGACLIEKHFTDSRANEGADHGFAIEPDELGTLVDAVRDVESGGKKVLTRHVKRQKVRAILGEAAKTITPLEKEIYPCEKRFLRARRDIAPGELFDVSNIGCLRFVHNGSPGLHTRRFQEVLGQTAARPIYKGDGITEDDVALGEHQSAAITVADRGAVT